MLHRISLAMKTESFNRITGEIEGDETFVGGKCKNMHKSKRATMPQGGGTVGQAVVHEIIQHGGDVRCKVVPNQRRKPIQSLIRENVEPGATVYTDALHGYNGLSDEYVHAVIDHAISYVDGRVHTNCMENFWSLLKRSLSGTYVAVPHGHSDRYLDKQTMRFNSRKDTDTERLQQVNGFTPSRRLTYAQLTEYAE